MTLDPIHANHDRDAEQCDRISALYQAVSWLVHGETSKAVDALRRLDPDVVALAAGVGAFLSAGAEQVMAERIDPFGPDMPIGGFPVGAGSRRAI